MLYDGVGADEFRTPTVLRVGKMEPGVLSPSSVPSPAKMTAIETTRRDRVNSTGSSDQCGDTLVSDGDVQSISNYLTPDGSRSINPIAEEFGLLQAYVSSILGVLGDASTINDDLSTVQLIEVSGGDGDIHVK